MDNHRQLDPFAPQPQQQLAPASKLNVLSDFINVDAIFRRMLKLDFDAAEMSTAHYLVARQRGIFEDVYGVKRTDVTWVTDFPKKM